MRNKQVFVEEEKKKEKETKRDEEIGDKKKNGEKKNVNYLIMFVVLSVFLSGVFFQCFS